MKKLVILSIIICLTNSLLSKPKKFDIIIINGNNKPVKLRIEIADTKEKREKGLMFRNKLDRNNGMLFIFTMERYRNFWMKNTNIPLSIAYINKYGIINEIYDMKPLDTSKTYPSIHPAKYAIEVNRGWFERNNIKKGCRVMLNGCIGK